MKPVTASASPWPRLVILAGLVALSAVGVALGMGYICFTLPVVIVLLLYCSWGVLIAWRDRPRGAPWPATAALVILVGAGLAILNWASVEWLGIPRRYSESALLGKTEAQVKQALGKPTYDWRVETPGGPPVISYNYGMRRVCNVTFDERGVVIKVEHIDD